MTISLRAFLLTVLLADAISSRVTAAPLLQEVASGVLVRPSQVGIVFEATGVANVGAIVGKSCVAVIDTGGSVQEGKALRAAIEAHTTTPICYVINTHGHPDHILGNTAFADISGVEFYGHHALEVSSASAKETWLRRLAVQTQTPVTDDIWLIPTQTVKHTSRLQLGDRIIELQARQDAHSHSDLTVFDNTTGTLWLSDLLFSEHLPVLAGSIDGWISLLKSLDKQTIQRVIPGHGPPSLDWPNTTYTDQLSYLQTLRSQTLQDIQSGLSLFDAQSRASLQTNDDWPLYQQYHARNLARAWAELEWLD